MRDPIKEENWKLIIDRLIKYLDGLPDCREKKMTQLYLEELKYHFWHYKLGPYCFCTDVDFVEYRSLYGNLEIVALFEVKTALSATDSYRLSVQKQILAEISEKLKTPFYNVTFSEDLKQFKVERLDSPEYPVFMDEEKYIDFVRNLGKS